MYVTWVKFHPSSSVMEIHWRYLDVFYPDYQCVSDNDEQDRFELTAKFHKKHKTFYFAIKLEDDGIVLDSTFIHENINL